MVAKFSKNQVLASLFWKFMEKGGTQLIQFVVQIVLARLLLPEDYGLLTLVLVFISFASIFVESGFNTALIQKKDADELDFSSVFFFGLFVAILLYWVLFFLAPLISSFYSIPQMKKVLRVIAVLLPFGAINSTQNAILSRKLQFKLLFLRSTLALLISGTIGIIMAYLDFGVWALVAQSLSFRISVTLILWFTLKWRPKLTFSFARLKSLFRFSWKLMVGGILNTSYRELRNLIIGKVFQSSALGFYNRGEQFPKLLVSNIDGSIQSVMFPVLASQQDNRSTVKAMMRRSIITSAFIIFPMMVGLAVIAESLVPLLMTSKWLPAVPFVQIFCLNYAFHPIQSANQQAINGLGYSGISLRLNFIRRIAGIIVLLLTVQYGVQAIAMGQALISLLSSIIYAHPNKKLLDYSYVEQLGDVLPSLFLSLAMGALVYCIKWISLPMTFTLIIQILLGVVIYTGLAWLFKMESFHYVIRSARSFFGTKLKRKNRETY